MTKACQGIDADKLQHFSCVFKSLLPHKAETQESYGKGCVSWQKSWVIWSSDSSLQSCLLVVLALLISREFFCFGCEHLVSLCFHKLSLICTVPFKLCPLAPGFQCPLEPPLLRPPSEASPNSDMPGNILSHLTAAPIPAWVRISWSYCRAAFYPDLTINICPWLKLKKFKPGVARFSRSLLLHISENYGLQRSLRMPASHEVRFATGHVGQPCYLWKSYCWMSFLWSQYLVFHSFCFFEEHSYSNYFSAFSLAARALAEHSVLPEFC